MTNYIPTDSFYATISEGDWQRIKFEAIRTRRTEYAVLKNEIGYLDTVVRAVTIGSPSKVNAKIEQHKLRLRKWRDEYRDMLRRHRAIEAARAERQRQRDAAPKAKRFCRNCQRDFLRPVEATTCPFGHRLEINR